MRLSCEGCESYGYDEFKGTNNIQCFKALNASNPIYKDLTVRNPGNRQWNCTSLSRHIPPRRPVPMVTDGRSGIS